jgi:hypothetical protein
MIRHVSAVAEEAGPFAMVRAQPGAEHEAVLAQSGTIGVAAPNTRLASCAV